MQFVCEFCGEENWFYPGWLAQWFGMGQYMIICPECGSTTDIPSTECLDYMLWIYRN